MIRKLRNRLPDWLWAGGVTFVVTFLTAFGAGAAGWWQDLLAFVSTAGTSEFPDISVLGAAAASALGAAVAGTLNALYRWAQVKGLLPGSAPRYPTEPG